MAEDSPASGLTDANKYTHSCSACLIAGGGFNVYCTSKVCDAAYYLYRERFLAREYGNEGMIEATAPPPDTFDSGYEVEEVLASEASSPAITER